MSSTSIHKLSSPFPKFPSTEVNVNATTHLMDNSWSWRNNQHILKGLGTPFKENKPFFVSLKFNFLIFFQCFWPKIKRKKSQKNCENILLKQFCAIFRVLNTLCVFYGTPKKKINIWKNALNAQFIDSNRTQKFKLVDLLCIYLKNLFHCTRCIIQIECLKSQHKFYPCINKVSEKPFFNNWCSRSLFKINFFRNLLFGDGKWRFYMNKWTKKSRLWQYVNQSNQSTLHRVMSDKE